MLSRKNMVFVSLGLFIILSFIIQSYRTSTTSSRYPTAFIEHEEEEENNPDKNSLWSSEQSAQYQEKLKKYMSQNSIRTRGSELFADGELAGEWTNIGPVNLPGAFKFAEMLDGTDTVYGVTWNHYSGEYNSKSYILRGTVYNPTTKTGGDDFVRLTGHWPNRYKDLIAIKVSGKTRLIAGIENGPVYYSDDEGNSWTQATGAPASVKSTIVNRQDSNTLYTTDGIGIFVSTDGGVTFTQLQDFGTLAAETALYSPRYAVQQGANGVYLYRDGDFFTLVGASFNKTGSLGVLLGSATLSIGGDTRKFYINSFSSQADDHSTWSSSDGGVTWQEKQPQGYYYGTARGFMRMGYFLAAHPENPDTVIGGYTTPVISQDGLNTTTGDGAGWSGYQNGPTTDTTAYFNQIRFNYHPDFQGNQFFYNKDHQLFTLRCSDGGMFVSYKEWFNLPTKGVIDNSGYDNAHYINITSQSASTALIYRSNLFTGNKSDDHINYSTQDQGSQNRYLNTSGARLLTYQAIGGDGYPLGGYGGDYVWRWVRFGDSVYAPISMYDATGNIKSVSTINTELGNGASTTFPRNTSATIGWPQVYFDQESPNTYMWILTKSLDRVFYDGTTLTPLRITKGTNQVAALAQSKKNPNKLWMLQDGMVYQSIDHGSTFDNGSTTPFVQTTNDDNIGKGVVLPTDDMWILFAGPSSNSVGAILSKDGGLTWKDVTGSFPSGNDAQINGLIATPDGQYIFAGTDLGPWVFIVAKEKWYPLGQSDKAAYFNTTDMEYLAGSHTIRFATFGSGVWDFKITDPSPLGSQPKQLVKSFSIQSVAHNSLKLTVPTEGMYTISLVSVNGQVLMHKEVSLTKGLQQIALSTGHNGKQTAILTVTGVAGKISQRISLY